MTSTLDHLEKTFSELYRKEIDQEENVWRTLPFFAAAIALQFGVIAGLLPKPGVVPPGFATDIRWLMVMIILCDGLTILCLLASIAFPDHRHEYLPSETDILRYAEKLDAKEREVLEKLGPAVFDAAQELRKYLVEAYALATANNRRVNRHGVRMRKIAGVSILLSMLLTLVLFSRLVLFILW